MFRMHAAALSAYGGASLVLPIPGYTWHVYPIYMMCLRTVAFRQGAYPSDALGMLASVGGQSILGVTGCAVRMDSARLNEWA